MFMGSGVGLTTCIWDRPLFCVATHRAPMSLSSVKEGVGSIKTVRPGMVEAKLIGTMWMHFVE